MYCMFCNLFRDTSLDVKSEVMVSIRFKFGPHLLLNSKHVDKKKMRFGSVMIDLN